MAMIHRSRRGSAAVLLAGLIGAAVAAWSYVTPATGIDHSIGVLVALGACLLLAVGALVVMALGRGIIAGIFIVLVLLDILGTGLAGYMLQSLGIMAAMVLAAAGWVLWLVGGRT
jgi:hypothetical protein